MADFSAVLRKTIDGLSENTPAMRARVYDKARQTVESKLAAVSPPPSEASADRQRKMLEDAIAQVEADYAATTHEASPPPEEENEFDRIFAEYEAPDTRADQVEAQPAHDHGGEPLAYSPDEPVEPQDAFHDPLAPAYEEGEAPAADPAEGFFEQPEERWDSATAPVRSRPRRMRMGIVAMLVLLIVLAVAGYAIWLNKAQFADFLGLGEPTQAAVDEAPSAQADSDAATETSETTDSADTDDQQTDQAEEPDTSMASEESQPEEAAASPQKFTQRLLPNGEEVDPGPAEEKPTLGEGTSVATATPGADGQQSAAQADESAEPAGTDSESATVPVGQRAIFYEERTNSAQGSAQTGSVVWSVVQESPGNDLPPEPAIRAEATIPDKDVQLRMTIRRNADPSLPASHIVELIFLTPDDFEGGGIESVLRFAMKRSEEDTGNPLLGVPAKIADGFFLIALNDTKADLETNRTLLRRQEWIDIPIVYKSGRRALITLQKGIPGDKAFDEALDAWQSGSSG